ncbi:MAG TPA: hypothetical protein V6D47_01815 [Oscillatoriaceae cyanobacterium]
MLARLAARCVRYLERQSGARYKKLVEMFTRFNATRAASAAASV